MRVNQPVKAMRRMPVDTGETDQTNDAGATGTVGRGRRRPGRAASLLSSANRTRSQRWRVTKQASPSKRRGTLAKGSRTGRNRTK